MKRVLAVLPCLLILAQPVLADLAPPPMHLFRYYDTNHKVHIDQQVTDDALTYGYQELDSNMQVVRTVPPRPTAKDLERIKAYQAQQAAAEEQAKQDAVLKRMYSSPQDAMRDRDSQVDAIQLHIDFSNSSIVRLRSLRAQEAERAAGFERNGIAVPKDVQDNIQKYDSQIAAAQADIKTNRTEQDQVRTQFANIIKRLHDIQAGTAATTAASDAVPGATP